MPTCNVKNIVIPSEEYHVKMFPMDFEEFAWATGNGAMLPLIERRFRERLPVGADMHRQIMDVFRQYLVVGGMPQHNVSPIEVKSGRKYSTVSLDKYRAKYAAFLDTPFVLHKKDVMTRDGVVYLPLYMTYLLSRRA